MKVQRVQPVGQDRVTWLVIGDDYLPIRPIQDYLTFLEDLERSPHTIRAYANHLSLYWQYLEFAHLDWTTVGLSEIAEFVSWLRRPRLGVISLQEDTSRRSEATIHAILSAVAMLYDYHTRLGKVEAPAFYQEQRLPHRRYKGLLYHITKHKPVQTRLVKLKVPKRIPQALTVEQVEQLTRACSRIRDQFLVSLLYESGLRVGQALGLRHEDVHSWDNIIWVVPRPDNRNGARAKTREAYSVPISPSLMQMYTDYLLHEFEDTDSDYVFVNLWQGTRGQPMTYEAVADLFGRLGAKTGLAVHPHMLRHTHATDLLRSGMDAAYVQKRLGHASVQTTMNTYIHLTEEDMKHAYHAYLQNKPRSHGKED